MRAVHIRRSLAVLAVLCAIGVAPQRASPDSDESNETEAACLINFSRFVEWPGSTFQNPKVPFVIGIVGVNPFGINLARRAAQEFVAGRTIEVRQFRPGQDFRSCQILFVGSAQQKIVAPIIALLGASSVLTVSDANGFVDWGGMIEFSRLGDQVRFSVNDKAVKLAGIKVSANVLRLASEVIDTPGTERN